MFCGGNIIGRTTEGKIFDGDDDHDDHDYEGDSDDYHDGDCDGGDDEESGCNSGDVDDVDVATFNIIGSIGQDL